MSSEPGITDASDASTTVTFSGATGTGAIDAAVTPVDTTTGTPEESFSGTGGTSSAVAGTNTTEEVTNNASSSGGGGQQRLATAVPVDDSDVVVADPVLPEEDLPPTVKVSTATGSTPGGTSGDDETEGIKEASSGFRKACIGITIAVAAVAIVIIVVAARRAGAPPPEEQPVPLVPGTGGGGTTKGDPVVPPVTSETPSPADLALERREAMLELLAPLYEDHGGIGIFEESKDRRLALEWILADGIAIPDPEVEDYFVDDDDDGNKTTTTTGDEGGVVFGYEEAVFNVVARYVMAVLYYATGGDSWDDDYKFLGPTNICEWVTQTNGGPKGVVCNDDGKPSQLVMWWNNMVGTIPHEITFFAEDLVGINFGGGSLSGTIPPELGKLTNLQTLGLHDLCLTGTVPNDILELPNLGVMLLSNNQFGLDYDPGVIDGNFCDGGTLKPDKFAFFTDCKGEVVPVNETATITEFPTAPCECCVCCDPDIYMCTDQVSKASYSNLFLQLSEKTGIVQSFDSTCLSRKQREYIAEDCPCLIKGAFYEQNRQMECTTNCTREDAITTLLPPLPNDDGDEPQRFLLRHGNNPLRGHGDGD